MLLKGFGKPSTNKNQNFYQQDQLLQLQTYTEEIITCRMFEKTV